MKKFVKILPMVLVVGMLMVGCSSNEESAKNGDIIEEKETVEEETVEEETIVEEEEEEVALEIGDTFKVGKFSVKVNSIKRIVDYDEKDSVVINFDWTNNSDETVSWSGEMFVQAFQDGQELDSGYVAYEDESEDNSYRDIRPDNTLEGIEEVFHIQSENEIELEVTEWLTMDDKTALIILDFPTE